MFDIVGNVGEWCAKDSPDDPSVLRGGAFNDPVAKLRSASRAIEIPEWDALNPSSPPSSWWLSAADFAGFRIVRSVEDEGATPATVSTSNSTVHAEANAESAPANYQRYCTGCHGADGKGQTPLGKKNGARDYTSAEVKATLNDEAMLKTINEGLMVNGKHVMPSYAEKLTGAEMTRLVHYMRSFH